MTKNPIEAIRQIKELCNPMDAKFDQIMSICNSVLDHPLRNCDVGSADEQSQRFDNQCAKYGHSKLSSCANCPLDGERSCYFTWGQMGYDESDKLLDGKEIDLKGSENVTTVSELMAALRKMPIDAKVCGSKPNGHDEYDCEERPFWVQHYNDGSDDGLVYVGIDYKHPN